ncbi:MAG: pyridoxal phosphate-dependent aminotransferase [Actinomycetota bacterium]|nr:pyridoxal phosphate-dependent aminotransferase [Actinomycetota bacterium]MDA8208751.1 pyridoxal phosphate-dependent aminotransferase [Actinomycetota bacterium]
MTTESRTRISARVASVAESATLAIDAKAKALKAAGVDVIGFGAGEPDFPTPPFIVEAAARACADPRNHRYTPTAGLPELREAIAAKTLRDSGLAIEASQVLVTNGGKHAIYNAFATLLDPGDEVLVPEPYWTTYPEAIRLAGGVPVFVPSSVSSGYKVSPADLDRYMSPRTKVLLFVSPSNPTGAVYTRAETEAVAAFAAERGLWILADEIYEHLVYDEAVSTSIATVDPRGLDYTVIVNGVAKTYAMTGWRVGWMIGPKDVAAAAINLQSQSTSNVNNIAQRAAIAALTGDQSEVEVMRQAFDRRRQLIVSLLRGIPGVVCPMPEGAFYAYPEVGGLLARDYAGTRPTNSSELAAVILDQAKVAVVPGEAFGTPGFFRLSYALSDADIEEGIKRIAKLVEQAV